MTMNALTKIDAQNAGMVPANIREAMDLATLMAKGRITVPKDLQNNPADCLVIIEQAVRWRMSPFAVVQEVSVIQGKLMFSGKIVAAAVHTSGVLDGRLEYDYSGKGADLAVTVRGRLRGEAEARTVHVTLASAKTSNQHWAKSPEQMLSYHGARVWARRHAPEVMLGVYAPEEFDDRPEPKQVHATVLHAEPKPAQQRITSAELDAATNGDAIPDFDQPKPDRLRKVADRIKERLSEAVTPDDYNKIMGHEGIAAEWSKIRSDRPELDAELEEHRQAQLDRIAEEHAGAAHEPDMPEMPA